MKAMKCSSTVLKTRNNFGQNSTEKFNGSKPQTSLKENIVTLSGLQMASFNACYIAVDKHVEDGYGRPNSLISMILRLQTPFRKSPQRIARKCLEICRRFTISGLKKETLLLFICPHSSRSLCYASFAPD